MCIRPFLPHGHGFGWEEVWEIGGFANGIVRGGKPVPRVAPPRMDRKDRLVRAKFSGELTSASVGFTTARSWKNQALSRIPCKVEKGELVSTKPLPPEATAFMINARGGGVWNDGCIDSVLVYLK